MIQGSFTLLLSSLASAQPNGGGLNFDAVDTGPVVAAAHAGDATSVIAAVVVIVVLLGLVGVAGWSGRQAQRPAVLDLARAPVPAKLATIGVLTIFALTHALGAAAVYLNTRELYPTATEYFFYLKPARLASLSHAHLMAIATMDGIVAALYTLGQRDGVVTRAVVVAAFLGVTSDIASWWLTKYAGGGFETLSMVSGVLFSAAFLVMSGSVLWCMWRPARGKS